MAVELELGAGLLLERRNELRDALRHGGVGIGHAPANRVADAELRLAFGLLHHRLHEGDHPAVDVGAGCVLEVHARRDAVLHGRKHGLEVLLDRLFLAVVAELIEDVVVGGGGEHASFFDAPLADLVQLLYVFRVGANPGRDLREFVGALEQLLEHPLVALLVDERLDRVDAARTVVEPVKKVDVA